MQAHSDPLLQLWAEKIAAEINSKSFPVVYSGPQELASAINTLRTAENQKEKKSNHARNTSKIQEHLSVGLTVAYSSTKLENLKSCKHSLAQYVEVAKIN
jgi:hypothetical protein